MKFIHIRLRLVIGPFSLLRLIPLVPVRSTLLPSSTELGGVRTSGSLILALVLSHGMRRVSFLDGSHLRAELVQKSKPFLVLFLLVLGHLALLRLLKRE